MEDSPISGGPESSGASLPATEAEVRHALSRVLASPAFVNAGRQARFLCYVCERALGGRGAELKEYVLGTEVFDRPPAFDPRTDSVVRVQAGRLRQRLEGYYASDGRDDPIAITLPKGHYVPVFTRRAVAGQAAALPEPLAAPVFRSRARLRRSLIPAALVGVAAVVLVAAAVAAYLGRAPAPHVTTLAVLPFESASDQPGAEYVSFGLVEEVSARLTRVPGLRVVARSSAEQAAREKGAVAANRRLGTDALVEGSVRRAGARLRVTAQLVSASDGSRMWGETYERPLPADEFALQDEIADAIARAVSVRLAGRPSVAPARTVTLAPEVRAIYWQARYIRSQRTEAARLESRDLFRKVVAAAPGFAAGQMALGEVCATMAFHKEAPVDASVAEATAALRRALELDESAADAHALLGWIAFFHDWDWPAAEERFRRALALDPNLARAHQLYAMALSSRGRFDEAVAHSEAAVVLDPVSYAVANELIAVLYSARRYDDGIAQARRALALDPQARTLHGALGVCLLGRRRFGEAAAEFETLIRAFGRGSFMLSRLAQAKALGGDVEAARALAAELEEAAARGDAYYTHLAYVLVALGDRARALECLERGVERRESDIVFAGVEQAFDPIRGEPRFARILDRIGVGGR
jgi:TolB-like protein/tetratricopeptide (TPR) repeat protein